MESGLGFWGTQLLSNTKKHGPSASKIIAYSLGIDGDYVGDLYLLSRLRSLASNKLTEPLLALSGAQTTIRDTEVALTKFGSAVLSGKVSSYPTNAVDEWIGGVHLFSSTGNLWFIDNGQLIEANKT